MNSVIIEQKIEKTLVGSNCLLKGLRKGFKRKRCLTKMKNLGIKKK